MEIVDPSEQAKHQHVWLKWLGLEEPPPDADAWVAVARGFLLDGQSTDSSPLASRLVDVLGQAGINARQRLYQFYNAEIGNGSFVQLGGMETCVAVVVHNRDLPRAVQVATGDEDQLDKESTEPLAGELSDDELTRQALKAGPPPPD